MRNSALFDIAVACRVALRSKSTVDFIDGFRVTGTAIRSQCAGWGDPEEVDDRHLGLERLAKPSVNIVLLTCLGGGAFGNDDAWIDAAMRRALIKVKDFSLDIHLVSFGAPLPSMLALENAFG